MLYHSVVHENTSECEFVRLIPQEMGVLGRELSMVLQDTLLSYSTRVCLEGPVTARRSQGD